MIDTEALRIIEEAMAKKHIAKFKDLAVRIECSERSLRGWLKGEHTPKAYSLGKMGSVLGIDAHALFFSSRSDAMPEISRRTFIAGTMALPMSLTFAGFPESPLDNTLQTLGAMTAQYRLLQRQGAQGIEQGIRGHISSIQATLENTISDENRRELWRLLSRAQLLARLNITDKKDLAKGKTWNEFAIASAQNSGDQMLLAATIGHLAHLYMMWPEDTATARQLLTRAHELADKLPALDGWLYSIEAATAAKEGNHQQSEEYIDRAMLAVHRMDKGPEHLDVFYSDVSLVGLQAFAGNSLLNVGETARAYKMFQSINLSHLSRNRHASIYYDIARSFVASNDLSAAQTYATKAIDAAVETSRWYIVPRFLTLAQSIQQRDPQEPNARAISEYARITLQTNWRA